MGGIPLKSLAKILITLTMILVFGVAFNLIYSKNQDHVLIEKQSDPIVDKNLEKKIHSLSNQDASIRPSQGISVYIGRNIDDFQKKYGTPTRIEPSFYGYDWWIYHQNNDQYMQVGVADQTIVTIVVVGEKINAEPFIIGQRLEDIYKKVNMQTEVEVKYNEGVYRFVINEEDVNYRPLIPLGDIYAQLYLDKFTGELLFVRFMDKKTLLELRPYDLTYRGELIKPRELSQDEWAAAERGTEKQIYDLTNIVRSRYSVPPLEWDEKTAQVALLHSQNMFETETFSHESEKFGDLADRLEAKQIYYEKAGENIAYQYSDSIAVIAGWLNSKGHRETFLDKDFTHIGVGVYQKYYTQNFIRKTWE